MLLLLLPPSLLLLPPSLALLYPRDSSSRESKSLDGLWRFKLSPKSDPDVGFREAWYGGPLAGEEVLEMPVPSSYNDITTNSSVRDFVGWAWYDTTFFAPASWEGARVVLRFGSVHYTAVVYVNGQEVGGHAGGHMAFEMEVGAALAWGLGTNRVTVAVNNTLGAATVPQGEWVWQEEGDMYPAGYSTLDTDFDFFNYAGLHRSVVLYTTPAEAHIKDIAVATEVTEDLALATLRVEVEHEGPVEFCLVCLRGHGLDLCLEGGACQGALQVEEPGLWWPYLMSPTPGTMYELEVSVGWGVAEGGMGEVLWDTYVLPVGLRQVTWTTDALLINHRPFYFQGVARHEDAATRGKGLDLPTLLRDQHLIEWLGANSFRTSHYPYAEETLDLADRRGIVVIAEAAAVSLAGFGEALLANHLQAVTELVGRDRNHPSVVMWSVANEPRSFEPEADEYFAAVAAHTKALDTSRPITLAQDGYPLDYLVDFAAHHMDIISVNKYFGWYTDHGHLELAHRQLVGDLRHWRAAHGKPVMVTEYGADTVAGLHTLPAAAWSEEFQGAFMAEYHRAFDEARAEGWFIGEMVWNFADFMTKQEVRRVEGNRKGLFTRDRQPKAAAHLLRGRYWALTNTTAAPNY